MVSNYIHAFWKFVIYHLATFITEALASVVWFVIFIFILNTFALLIGIELNDSKSLFLVFALTSTTFLMHSLNVFKDSDKLIKEFPDWDWNLMNEISYDAFIYSSSYPKYYFILKYVFINCVALELFFCNKCFICLCEYFLSDGFSQGDTIWQAVRLLFAFGVISFVILLPYFFYYTRLFYKRKDLQNFTTPFQQALQQCETRILDFSQKLQAAKAKLQQLPTIEYLNEKEKQAFSQQITQSQSLYQNQLNNYASSFFKLHLSQQKQQLGTIINEVFYQNKEVDSNELNVITENINSLLAHDYWQYTDMDKSSYQAMQPILAKLKKVDQRETFAEQVADLAPTKDLLNLDDHELQTQIELADLKNTENLAQQTLTEFTQSTQLLNDELARLQAENEVADRFG